MSYAAVTDLELRLGTQTVIELTNPKRRADSINTPVADAAIADATGIIDSYIGQRVSLPLDIVPALVKTLAIDLAVYYLKVKLGNTGNTDNATTKLYDDAIKHLERFAKGDTSLGLAIPDDTADDDANQTSNHADISSEDRQFTRNKMGRLT